MHDSGGHGAQATQDGELAAQLMGVVRKVQVIDAGPKLGHLPPLATQFKLLTTLDVGGAAITYLPQTICNLKRLTVRLAAAGGPPWLLWRARGA